jgi:hypothetical protein
MFCASALRLGPALLSFRRKLQRDKSLKTGDFHQIPAGAIRGAAIDWDKPLTIQGKYIATKPARRPRQRPNLQRPTDLAYVTC